MGKPTAEGSVDGGRIIGLLTTLDANAEQGISTVRPINSQNPSQLQLMFLGS